MFWVILSLLCAPSYAATLGTAYLPPPNAKDAGGHEEDLQVPLEPPYIDPYSDNRHLVPEEELNYFGYRPRSKSLFGDEDEGKVQDSSDDSIKYPVRFLYASYTYASSDNTIVTVTYTSNKNKPKNKRTQDDNYYEYNESGLNYDEDFGLFGEVPTPPSLPQELARAFAFHKILFQKDKKEDTRVTQSKNEEPGKKSTTNRRYSFRDSAPIKNFVNNVQTN